MDQNLKRLEELQRKLEIEAALERVRARAMAMQSTEELSDVLSVLFQQFDLLGIAPKTAWLTLWNPEENTFTYRSTGTSGLRIQGQQVLDIGGMDIWKELYEKWKTDTSDSVEVLFYAKEDLKQLFSLLEETFLAMPKEERLTPEHFPNGGYSVQGHCKFGYLGYTITREPSEEEKQILTRFATEFGRVYQRFLEIQKAEAQAREAQIELAVERVRAIALSMHKSEDLIGVATVLRRELESLEIPGISAATLYLKQENGNIRMWDLTEMSGIEGNAPFSIDIEFRLQDTSEDLWFRKPWESSDPYFVVPGTRKEFLRSARWLGKFDKQYGDQTRQMIESSGLERTWHPTVVLEHGRLCVDFIAPPPGEMEFILTKIGAAFNLAYQRFLDLQNAENQAREAQIEAALERVRSRSMAMQQSEELKGVIQVIFDQLALLNINAEHAGIVVDYKAGQDWTFWVAETQDIPSRISIPYLGSLWDRQFAEAKIQGTDFFTTQLDFEEKNAFYRELLPHIPNLDKKAEEFYFACPGLAISTSVQEDIGLYIENFSGTPYSTEENEILNRFGKVCQQTYTRFLDIRKAEENARESEIQLALERVRARSMAMHKSEELSEVAAVLFEQIDRLGATLERLNLGIVREEEEIIEWWSTEQGGRQINHLFKGSIHEPTTISKVYTAWKEGKKSLVLDQTGLELKQWIRYVTEVIGLPFAPELKQERRVHSAAFFRHGTLLVSTPAPLPEGSMELLERFSAVFEQAYTRFLDLKKAEAQAREAQIEAALERVRAKSMAMHHTSELTETTAELFSQLDILGIRPWRCGLAIMTDDEKSFELWSSTTTPTGRNVAINGKTSATGHKITRDVTRAIRNKEDLYIYDLSGESLIDYVRYIAKDFPISEAHQKDSELPERLVYNCAIFNCGVLYGAFPGPIDEPQKVILQRFARVFEQAYTRFLDLQKAEKQAREAEIEAALERVRAKTMAMHNTDDIADTVITFFEELLGLGLDKSMRAGIGILSQSEQMQLWTASIPETSKTILHTGSLDMTTHPTLEGVKSAWNQGDAYFSYVLEGEELKDYFRNLNEAPDYPVEFDLDKLPETIHHRSIPFMDGILFAFTEAPLPEEIITILERFAAVFGQTYTRYLDLQKAEERARESRIEAALERVRAKALAMHSSEDLRETITAIFEELKNLNVRPLRLGLGLLNPDKPEGKVVTSRIDENEQLLEVGGEFELVGHPVLEAIYAHWKKQLDYYPILEGEEINSYYTALTKAVDVQGYGTDTKHYGCFLFFKEGGLYAWAAEPHSEQQISILKRFSRVLEIAYRRYNDLVESEAREKEAVKQASLDRVRAEIASMRTTEDLERITPLVWEELTTLGIPFFRCGVFIMNEARQMVHVYLTTPEGEALAVMDLPFDFEMPLIQKGVAHWRKQESLVEHWNQQQFVEMTKMLMEQGQVSSAKSYQAGEKPPERLVLHQVPFAQGMLYVGSTQTLSEAEMDIVQALTRTFAVAYARYEDFNQLEKTLGELKATQKQLVHAEKMASLGELTAGIAHEIKNPLNFVNNFSEVSKELLEELLEELKNGDVEEVEALAQDIIQNLEKVVHHGKRADSIVKGMLQHSRSGDGQKEPTDLNALADEYLRLAYHGLRAKDKSFNAVIETEFDPGVGTLELIPQDIGRVILNLLTNAFYAVNEKAAAAKASENGAYEPSVSVRTKKQNGMLELSVSDNGGGIPQKILDKIFQPFFTTKPTGEGTGLGLSLSYDIVKAHGGELSAETAEGEGTTFFIKFKTTS